jgi:phage-related holin
VATAAVPVALSCATAAVVMLSYYIDIYLNDSLNIHKTFIIFYVGQVLPGA